LLADLAAVDGLDWVRVSYLQPAEMRLQPRRGHGEHAGRTFPTSISFQHASAPVLRRCGGSATPTASDLLAQIRARRLWRESGATSSAGSLATEADLAVLEQFLVAADLDAIGVFGYSDEDGTEQPSSTASSRRARSSPGAPG
jgi:tRNA A37 methylthiotransferase MiaB